MRATVAFEVEANIINADELAKHVGDRLHATTVVPGSIRVSVHEDGSCDDDPDGRRMWFSQELGSLVVLSKGKSAGMFSLVKE